MLGGNNGLQFLKMVLKGEGAAWASGGAAAGRYCKGFRAEPMKVNGSSACRELHNYMQRASRGCWAETSIYDGLHLKGNAAADTSKYLTPSLHG